ncbi:MAG: DUF3237 domain-containing protein [Clostridiales bacterium]|nr:DUF3237 domain-containing protein [Clostridiales bacterium]
MQELFSIHVILTQTHTVQSPKGAVSMVLFEGTCDCDFFHGRILPGGVDTQRDGALSARYMLEGTDAEGNPTRIFIENNGVWGENGQCVTHPLIRTDNPRLAWLEEAVLTGGITGHEKGVDIHFYQA